MRVQKVTWEQIAERDRARLEAFLQLAKTEEDRKQTRDEFYEHCKSECDGLNGESTDPDWIEYTADELEVFRQEVFNALERDKLKKRFLALFKRRSYYNEIPGECLFYVLISLFTKSKMVYDSTGRRIRPHVHFFFIQNSRTGKDQAFQFLTEVIDAYNIAVVGEGLPEISYMKLDGHETVESMLNRFKKDKKGNVDPTKLVQGILSRFDLFIAPEASVYMVEQRGQRQTRAETLLQALEGTPIDKSLVGWDDHITRTVCNGCLVAATRPIERMKQHIVNSGLQQRALNYMRQVDNELRQLMNRQASTMKYTPSNDFNFEERMKEFVDQLVETVRFIDKSEFTLKKTSEISTFINTQESQFFSHIYNEVVKKEQREILESFVANFNTVASAIAINNAAVHNRTEVTFVDFSVAYSLLRRQFEQLVVWIEEKIEEDFASEKKRMKETAILRRLFREKSTYKQNELRKLFAQAVGCSISTASYKLKDYTEHKSSLYQLDKKSKIYSLKNI